MIELCPCPFCGSDDLHGVQSSEKVQIECSRCSALGPFAIGDSQDERRNGAAKLWNMRAKMPKRRKKDSSL